ncbi:PepSY domain-containing protein [Xanthomonas campestris]|uniref:PepSY domain-containing protein n=2 Tax=Xanthomonas campestris TaxID=339 RepID=UPI002B233141|nr:PepSY domain-containing protein [Xanthomonas campestris]MEA9656968.1 PepSY domain-containing protein [Xanthomonas campestris pv. raphani]MEA9754742.1 PepSY domain-containing protein [Xanthomonas campestris pv. raphani]MEA9762389.1 PepSY domain-containing protein [Xanthomonas campestris pv. raphani]MEA9814897.1 PepSY domain-containing protein [Xanthomonas campestris pv. raphani]MEA9907949.1 PepSY domain-containing protein [Xanthomonas campestris pv. raphani]
MHASDRPARRRPKLFWLVWLHRWTGVAFCLMFAVWFASGLVLAFVPFPSLSPQQRWSAAERIDLSRLMVAPAQALRSLRDATALRLVSIGGRPSYVVGSTTATVAVDGIDGQVRGVLPPEAAGAIAAAFGHAAVRRLDGPLDYDQWSVHQKFDPWRPLYRAALQDDLGTVLYVSARTGEVVQRTRASERAWNWVGSVPHWLYFTQLRRSFTAWDRTVWWLALAALCSASAGTVLGVYRTWQRAHSPKPAWSGFRGWLRWHHGLGLIAAVFVLGWIFSGWLSMDHGRLFSKGIPDPAQVARYAGAPLPTVLAGVDAEAVRCLSGATLIEFTAVGGRPVAVGRGPAGPSVSDGMPGRITGTRLSPDAIRHAAARAWMLDHDPMPPDSAEALYRQADGIATDALRLTVASPGRTALYFDPASGTPLLALDASRRTYAWVYLAIHTTNFPLLQSHPVIRRIAQLGPLLLGLAFSLTGVVLGARRLMRSVAGKT